MTTTEFTQRLPSHIREKLSEHTVQLWLQILGHVFERGQTSRYDDKLRKSITETTGDWIGEDALKKQLKKMADAGLLKPHRIIRRYTEAGKALLPLFGFCRGDERPAGAYMAYTLPGMEPCFESSTNPKDKMPEARLGAANNNDPANNQEEADETPTEGNAQ